MTISISSNVQSKTLISSSIQLREFLCDFAKHFFGGGNVEPKRGELPLMLALDYSPEVPVVNNNLIVIATFLKNNFCFVHLSRSSSLPDFIVRLSFLRYSSFFSSDQNSMGCGCCFRAVFPASNSATRSFRFLFSSSNRL